MVVSAHVCAPVTTDWIAGGGSEVVGPPPLELTGSEQAENRAATASAVAATTERRGQAWRNMEGRAFGVLLQYERIIRAGCPGKRPSEPIPVSGPELHVGIQEPRTLETQAALRAGR